MAICQRLIDGALPINIQVKAFDMPDITPIEISVSEAEQTLQAVGIPFLPSGLEKYCAAFSSGGTELVHELWSAPFPDRVKVRKRLTPMEKPLRDFLRFYGWEISPMSDKVTKIKSPEWSRILAGFSAYPDHRQPGELVKKIDKIERQARKLYKDVREAQAYVHKDAGVSEGEGPNPRGAAVCRFLATLLHVAPEVFAKHLTTQHSVDRDGPPNSGPGITYMQKSLLLLRQKALEKKFSFMAKEQALAIKPSRLAKIFYENRIKP